MISDCYITSKKTGRSLTRSIELTEEQNQKLLELKSEDEVQAFSREIAQQKGIFFGMIEEVDREE